MKWSVKAIVPVTVALILGGAQLSRADDFYQKSIEKAEFAQWAERHPDWVSSHHDQYEFYLHHPEAAEQYRSEWSEWRGDSHAFSQWSVQHPDWVTSHHNQYEFFMRHPDQADKYHSEWADWHSEHRAEQLAFAEWAQQHPDWVMNHHDRYEYLLHHPEEAEHSRSEWYGYESQNGSEAQHERVKFAEWAASHPEWTESHRDRYAYFMAHPDQAEQFRHEWYQEHR